MTITVYKCGSCQYDSSVSFWYGSCTLSSDTQATNKRQTKEPSNQMVIHDIEGV
jgi:hypothetical protein